MGFLFHGATFISSVKDDLIFHSVSCVPYTALPSSAEWMLWTLSTVSILAHYTTLNGGKAHLAIVRYGEH